MGRWFFKGQRAVLNDSNSDWKEELSGVPKGSQGSVLDPLLAVLYINDLP